jgi:PmbA protein
MLFRGDPSDLDLDDGGDPAPAELKERALIAEDAARAVAGVTNSNGFQRLGIRLHLRNRHKRWLCCLKPTPPATAIQPVSWPARAILCSATMPGIRRAMRRTWKGPADIGARAAERAVARLNPVSVKAGVMPVLFDPRVATTLLGHFVGAISAAAVARQSSFLMDALGTQVFAPGVTVHDEPFRKERASQPRVRWRRAAGISPWNW